MYDFNAQRQQHDQPLPRHGQLRPGRPQHLGRRPQPQQHAVLAVRRLLRRVVRAAPTTCTPARRRPPSRRSRTSSGSRTRSRTSSSRNNIHSYGGYFMWAPGSYKNDGSATTAPAPNIGIEKYFFEAGEKILTRIKEHRNTVILPERTGPIADVLYSAAGNSADDQWYRKGIISYSFETGADRFITNPTTGAVTQIITGFQPCFSGVGTGGGDGHLQREPHQRGSRPGDGVRQRQLRHGRVRVRLRDGHHPAEARRSSTRPRRRPASRSTTGSTGTTRPRSSTTRPTARRRPCPRGRTTTSARAASARC